MKGLKLIFSLLLITIFILTGCSNGAGSQGNADTTATASDTITNVTNPGVGSAADDTAEHP